MDEFVPNGENIAISTFFKPVSKNFAPYFRGENRVIFDDICPCNEFERFVILLVIILESKINFFVRKFLEVFNLFYTSIIVIKNFEKGFLGSFRF